MIRAIRAGVVAVIAVLGWTGLRAWQELDDYEIEIVTLRTKADASRPDSLFLDGRPLAWKTAFGEAFSDGSVVSLYRPVRMSDRPEAVAIYRGVSGPPYPRERHESVPVVVQPRVKRCVLVIDLRGPISHARECASLDS